MAPTLYTTPLSANGRKALAVASHLGIDADVRLVNVYAGEGRSPEFLAVNPLGKIPTLVDGGFVLTESNAILVYLTEAYGGGELFASEPRERADVLRWLFFESAHWQPALTPVLTATVAHALRPDAMPAPTEPPDWKDAGLAPLLQLLESHLDAREFLACGRLTIADFGLAGIATYFRTAGFPFSSFPAFAAWYERVEALPAWRATATAPWT